jgi:hypothetical protein
VRRLSTTVITVALGAALGLSACGSDDKKADSTTAAAETTVAPEDVHVDAATVKAGLTKLPATIAAAIAAIGTPDAKAKLDAIEAEWFSFEGTVRDTDTDLYLAIEDQLTPLQRQIEDGDATTATATAATLSGLFTQYLTKYP